MIRGIEGLGDEFRIIVTREKTMDEMTGRKWPAPHTPEAVARSFSSGGGSPLSARSVSRS